MVGVIEWKWRRGNIFFLTTISWPLALDKESKKGSKLNLTFILCH